VDLFEYQGKQFFAQFGMPVSAGEVAFTVDEAVAAAERVGTPAMVKAQVHTGGRGKAGGVKVVKSLDDVEAVAKELIGKTLVTHQTGPEGKEIKRVYVEDGCAIKSEYYLALLLDRASGKITMMASTEGGMDIEEVADKTPEKIFNVTIDPATGLQGHHCRAVAFGLKLEGSAAKACQKVVASLYAAYIAKDAAMLEINPLVLTEDNEMVVLDAKMSFDSNALFRHPKVRELRDESEEDPMELEASKYDLAYIKLDGDIGCMVNGAGLAMATMDIIKLNGMFPAKMLGAAQQKSV